MKEFYDVCKDKECNCFNRGKNNVCYLNIDIYCSNRITIEGKPEIIIDDLKGEVKNDK